MADAIIYSSTDPDGPGVPTGSAIARMFSVLYACLVTGYGAKSGQGWVLVDNSGETGFTVRSPDGVYLCFESGPSAYNVRVYLAEELSSPYSYPPVGVNVRSQNYSPDYTSSIANRHTLHIGVPQSYQTEWWTVFARGSQILIFASSEELGFNSTAALYRRFSSIFVGNLVIKEPNAPTSGAQNFICLGGAENLMTSTASASTDIYPFRGAYTRLRHPETGLVETGVLAEINGDPWKYYSATRISLSTRAPDIALTRAEVDLSGVGSIAYLPGVFSSTPASNYLPVSLLAALGKGSNWEDLGVPIEVAGEEFFLVPGPHGLLFVSVDEAYW